MTKPAPGAGDVSKLDAPADLASWNPLVGRAILAFGGIELVTYQTLRFLPGSPDFSDVVEMGFAKRAKLILELLPPEPDAAVTQFAALVRAALGIARTRDLVAHNPMQITFYRAGDSGEWLLTPEIRHIVRDEDVLTLADLEKFATDAEGLREQLGVAMFTVFRKMGLMGMR